MANVDTTEVDVDATLKDVARRVRRSTTNRDVLVLCDAVLGMDGRSCPDCTARRALRAAAQRRWRSKINVPAN